MRRTLIAMTAVVALLGACQAPDETPTEAPSTAASEVAVPEMPVDAPPQEEVEPALVTASGPAVECRTAIGEAAAARLVERCIKVSPATRPPCNAANTCAMIEGEIQRSCDMYGPDEVRPPECSA